MKHTKGKVTVVGSAIYDANGPIATIYSYTSARTLSQSESEANANLIAEAFNVTNECGLTPRQLLDAYYGLVAELKEFKGLVNETE